MKKKRNQNAKTEFLSNIHIFLYCFHFVSTNLLFFFLLNEKGTTEKMLLIIMIFWIFLKTKFTNPWISYLFLLFFFLSGNVLMDISSLFLIYFYYKHQYKYSTKKKTRCFHVFIIIIIIIIFIHFLSNFRGRNEEKKKGYANVKNISCI